jgi:hypothetical protein
MRWPNINVWHHKSILRHQYAKLESDQSERAEKSVIEQTTNMIKGLRTVIYHVNDLAKARAWYGWVLEREPCFDQPFYVGYEAGGFELGLLPDGKSGPGGTVAYWGVANAAAAVKKLEASGATIRSFSIHLDTVSPPESFEPVNALREIKRGTRAPK